MAFYHAIPVLVVGAVYYIFKSGGRNKEERQKKIEEELQEKVVSNVLIFDSNIWMIDDESDEEDDFFIKIKEVCKKFSLKIYVPTFQLDELDKKRFDDKEKIHLKSFAKTRILGFQQEDLLIIEQVHNTNTYVDDQFVTWSKSKSQEGKSITFFTNDKSLLIKIRGIIPNVKSLTSNDFTSIFLAK